MLRNTTLWREELRQCKNGERCHWSAGELLIRIDKTHVDGDSENQFRIQEIKEVERIR